MTTIKESLIKFMVGGFALACFFMMPAGTKAAVDTTANAVSPGAISVENIKKDKDEVKALEKIIDEHVIAHAYIRAERHESRWKDSK